MSTSFWLDRSSNSKTLDYDIVIVGGGISGLSTAYWLKQEDPGLSIALIEKSRIGFGASGRNAGFITCGSVEHFNRMISKYGLERATEIWRFSQKNLELLKEHIIEDDHSLGFEQRGAFSLAAQENEFEELKSVAKHMDEMSIKNEIVESDEIYKRVGAQGFIGGIKYIEDASIDPFALLQKLKSKTDIDYFESTEVYKIEKSENGGRQILTDNGMFRSDMVVLNLNGYSANLHSWFKDKIFPTRGQCLVMRAVENFMESPCYANFYLDYFRQLPTGELLIGGFRQIEKNTEVGFSDHVTDVIQDALHSFVVEHLPQFKDSYVTHRWSGIMGFSVDAEPMIGAVPGDEQIMFAGGYTAHGIGLAFHTTKCLVDMIYGRPVPDWLTAKRF